MKQILVELSDRDYATHLKEYFNEPYNCKTEREARKILKTYLGDCVGENAENIRGD